MIPASCKMSIIERGDTNDNAADENIITIYYNNNKNMLNILSISN